MIHNLFCCSHFTRATIHQLQYIPSLWFTTCFGAKSIIISINQFTQATISVACLVIQAIAPALVSSSLSLRHLGNLLSFNIANIIIKSVGTHSENWYVWVSASVCETIRQHWRGTTNQLGLTNTISYISYITPHIKGNWKPQRTRACVASL